MWRFLFLSGWNQSAAMEQPEAEVTREGVTRQGQTAIKLCIQIRNHICLVTSLCSTTVLFLYSV